MRIPCPFCGERDLSEFVCRAEVSDELYARESPRGPIREHWYHAFGCRRWLTVHRDTVTHAIHGAVLAGGEEA